MNARRFFVDVPVRSGTLIALDRADAHHIARVLRLQAGDSILLAGDGAVWESKIVEVRGNRVVARVTQRADESGGELPVRVTVLQALAKGNKVDDVIEKVIELGAQRIVPFYSERSYGRATAARLGRWRRLARSAAQQSRRRILPQVAEARTWIEALAEFGRDADLVVAYEQAESGSLAPALARCAPDGPLTIAVGPEGGFTPTEIEAARAAGASLVSLGPTILRTETAAPALLAAIAALRGWW